MTVLADEAKRSKTVSEANVADPHTITAILRLFHSTPIIIKSVFGDDLSFKQAANEAFTNVVNKDMGKFSVLQMLAAYCDNLLKVRSDLLYYFKIKFVSHIIRDYIFLVLPFFHRAA